jgi:uncharacterized protein YndB with AHSA1/START domain
MNERSGKCPNPQFVYVTYIRTTPEKLWRALIAPEFTRQYWVGTWQESEWKPGASWRIMIPDGRVGDSGKVLEIDPPRRLVLSWRKSEESTGDRTIARSNPALAGGALT